MIVADNDETLLNNHVNYISVLAQIGPRAGEYCCHVLYHTITLCYLSTIEEFTTQVLVHWNDGETSNREHYA
jgi:hypothetical protein